MPLAEGRAGAGLLLPQNNFLDKISKRFRGTRQNFNDINDNDHDVMIIIMIKNRISKVSAAHASLTNDFRKVHKKLFIIILISSNRDKI